MAFFFLEDCETMDMGWGTYYGPMVVLPQADGRICKSPSLSSITEEILNYWVKRGGTTPNPLMKSRYNGLVWDLSNEALNKEPDYRTAIAHVESLVAVCDASPGERHAELVKKITRAYHVARGLNDKELIKKCINSAIKFEDSFCEDGKQGLGGLCFDLFITGKEKLLSDEQNEKLVLRQESRLERTSKNAPWICESAGIALATYYRRLGRTEDVRRVIEVVGGCFELACNNVAPIQASAWYQRAYYIYIDFDLHEKAQGVFKKIYEIGPDVVKNMQTFSYSEKIPREKLDAYLNFITEGGKDLSLNQIAAEFLPKKDKVKQQLLDIARTPPLCYLLNKMPLNDEGHPFAIIQNTKDDLEDKIIHQLSENLVISSFLLRHSLKKALERYCILCDDLVDFILQSPIFENDKKEIIKKGISGFLEKDHYSSTHLLIPQIEAAIRKSAELMGVAIFHSNGHGGLQRRGLGNLLGDRRVKDFFGVDTIFYFRTLLTDQRGWNLRNRICHGIYPSSMFNYLAADRILHVLLCLAQVRESAMPNVD